MELERVKKYLVERHADPLEAKPGGGGIVNVYFIVQALSDLILRHEGGDDLTEITIAGHDVPAITDTKFDASYRRTMLYLLHNVFKEHGHDIKQEIIKTLSKVASNPLSNKIGVLATVLINEMSIIKGAYNCALRPYDVGGKEYIEGYCRECPACYLFGFAVPEEGGVAKAIEVEYKGRSYRVSTGNYNVQAKVRGDLYPATAPSEMITGFRTHNAVDDITKTTGRALITVRYVGAGSLFVGKVSYYDVSLNELLLLLTTLAKVSRIGAMWSDYGRVRIHVPAIVFADQELGSGYEIAEEILKKDLKKPPNLEEIKNAIVSYVEGFKGIGYVYADRELTNRLYRIDRDAMKNIVAGAWNDIVKLKLSYEAFVQEIRERK